MPSLREVLTQTQTIHYSTSHKVEKTVAEELQALIGSVAISPAPVLGPPARTVLVSVAGDSKSWKSINPELNASKDWMMLRIQDGKGVEFLASKPHLVYTLFRKAMDEWQDTDVREFAKGKILYPAFRNLRPVYDIFLIQHARSVRNFDRPTYFKELARLGFSHAEVNGLAYPVPFEQGPKGELLHRF